MPTYMAVFHAPPIGPQALIPLRWQHGPTEGVAIHHAWTSIGAAYGVGVTAAATGIVAGRPGADFRTYIVFDCEPDRVADFVAYLELVSPTVELRVLNDYMARMAAYDAQDPEQLTRPPAWTDEQFRVTKENARRYINSSTPAEALHIWLETEPPEGGAEALRNLEAMKRAGLE
ncbi:MAG: hypothetical protein FI707_03345 [SAR202 cluster bacterium]|jgi:hypothetical protein|nr:hypothetical protein [Chloroflexota bacterium]MDP6420320.1 hypothetical protein [SAR202 cluster bacterium]HAL47970.1 hypothetical protein [Dehalococcoidia bacterium]MDP6665408.1 hypothetical protein [SAR202 cluster bacterium]MDP6800128.1 hypothetical protein [SAR202 cluster bacterium]|tara:strand:+ start:1283 stop:1804 length:522 start_codon:yes stop_codon:yes gene_type:complete